jgi:hypothetical protein
MQQHQQQQQQRGLVYSQDVFAPPCGIACFKVLLLRWWYVVLEASSLCERGQHGMPPRMYEDVFASGGCCTWFNTWQPGSFHPPQQQACVL